MGYILTYSCLSDVKGEVKNSFEKNTIELPLLTIINKEFLFYFLSTSPSWKHLLLAIPDLSFFLMGRVPLDFKERCVKGEWGFISLHLTV